MKRKLPLNDDNKNHVSDITITRGPCKPPSNFQFSQTIVASFSRRCQHEWFSIYDWLEYSESAFALYMSFDVSMTSKLGTNEILMRYIAALVP